MSKYHGEQTFKTTHWSLILSSRESDSDIRQKSLGQLCESYWFPLFVYLRRKGYSPDDSADYVQGFFSQLIEKDFLESASPEKGRFRWFLMSAIKRFASKQVNYENAIKRGGGARVISIDLATAEERYQLEPVDGWTAEKLFDRRWALEVLQQALMQLEQEQEERGKLEIYRELQSTLSGVPISQDRYQEIAEKFSMSAGAVKVAALRLREKYRKILQQLVAQTINESDNIDDELEALLSALRG
ncbi:MAG: sigma-70 family RNA polymerase sigma factor [Planctomycetota bacterium]